MKKSAIVSVLALALLLGTAFEASAQSIKIGTVDMKEVFQRYWRTKEAEAKMNDVRATVKRDLDERSEKRKALEAEITKLNDDIKKPEVSAAKKDAANRDREKKIAEWQALMKDLQSFTQEKDKALQDQTMRIRNGIVDEITKVVKEEVKSEQYDLVFDVSGNSVNNVPVVMYAAEKYDFTDKVITKLNVDAPKGTPTTEKPAEKTTEKAEDKPADKKK